MLKKWIEPEILVLGIENTKYGDEVTQTIDFSEKVGNITKYSFS